MENALFSRFKDYDIILASESPRRRELLMNTGIPFRTLVRPVSEEVPADMTPIKVVRHLASDKARMFETELKQEQVIVVTADTIVVCDGMIINKASDEAEAKNMLCTLSDKWHTVHTGVCIRNQKRSRVFHDTSKVRFRQLSEEEINFYIKAYQPFDKAGAYGIQEWIGYIGISSIKGSYANVMGLPVHKVYAELMELAARPPRINQAHSH